MKHTEETKRKLSEMRAGERNPFFGRKHSPESIERIREAGRGRPGNRTPAAQSVVVPEGVALGYLAGLIDGEGSIGVRAKGNQFLSIYNTELAVMEWLTANVGGHVGGSPDRRGRELCYCWTVQRARDVIAILCAVRPYLIAKAEDAERVRLYIEVTYGL